MQNSVQRTVPHTQSFTKAVMFFFHRTGSLPWCATCLHEDPLLRVHPTYVLAGFSDYSGQIAQVDHLMTKSIPEFSNVYCLYFKHLYTIWITIVNEPETNASTINNVNYSGNTLRWQTSCSGMLKNAASKISIPSMWPDEHSCPAFQDGPCCHLATQFNPHSSHDLTSLIKSL